MADGTAPGSATLCAVIAAGAFVLPPDGRAAPSSNARATGDWPAQFARCGASAADVLPDTGQVEFRHS